MNKIYKFICKIFRKNKEKDLDLFDASLDEHFGDRDIFYKIAEKHHGDESDFEEKYFGMF